MAGIYIHIPYCKTICSYCDFYRTTRTPEKGELIGCLIRELGLKRQFLSGETVNTVYFGGGTPSLLTVEEIKRLTDKIQEQYGIAPDAEITFEANPDDLSPAYLKELKTSTEINRLSIGVQSFIDRHLQLLKRRHDAKQAFYAINESLHAGFSNISIDLIYGIPEMTGEEWEHNLESFFEFKLPHLSAYHMTIEKGTLLYNRIKSGHVTETSEESSIGQYNLLHELTAKNGYIHYEISNFSRNGCISKHNSNYWKREKYLGIGPSAHSYDRQTRHWNISSNGEYIRRITNGLPFYTSEKLDRKKHFNEYIMVGLRTMWGINLCDIAEKFGIHRKEALYRSAKKYIDSGNLLVESDVLKLTSKGMFLSDMITADLLI